MYFKIRHGVT